MAVAATTGALLAGCGDPHLMGVTDQTASQNNGGALGGASASGAGSVGGAAASAVTGSGSGGATGSAGGATGAAAAADPATVTACTGGLTLAKALRLPTLAAGQFYTRCGTYGPERDWHVTLSPDGTRMAARTSEGTVRLIATAGWTEVAQLASPVGRLDAAAFSPDGATLATLSAEMGEIALWDAANGHLTRAFAGPPASTMDAFASALAFSPDGTRLATSLGTVIDLGTGEQRLWSTGLPATFSLVDDPENLDPGVAIPFMRYVAAGTRLFIDTQFQIGNSPPSEQIELRDPSTGAQNLLFMRFQRAFNGFALSPDGNLVAFGATAETGPPGITVVSTATGATVTSDATLSTPRVLAFSPDSSLIYTRDGDTIIVRAASDLHVVHMFSLTAGAVFLGVAPNGRLVTADPPTLTTWLDPATGAILRDEPFVLAEATWSANGSFGAGSGDASLFHFWTEPDVTELCAPAAPGSHAAVTALAESANGNRLAIGRDDGGIAVVSANANGGNVGAPDSTVMTGFGALAGVSVTNNGSRVAAIAASGAAATVPVGVFDAGTGTALLAEAGVPGTTVSVSPNGRWLAFVSSRSFVTGAVIPVVRVDTGVVAFTITGAEVVDVDHFSPDSTRLGVATSNGIEDWVIATGMHETTFPPAMTGLTGADMSPDWSVVGAQTQTPALDVWRADGTLLLSIPDNATASRVAGFSPDGALVAAELFDLHDHSTNFTAIHIVDVASGFEERLFGAIGDGLQPPRQVVISNDGARLFSLESPVVAVWCQ
jgi:WD40 repeat protein